MGTPFAVDCRSFPAGGLSLITVEDAQKDGNHSILRQVQRLARLPFRHRLEVVAVHPVNQGKDPVAFYSPLTFQRLCTRSGAGDDKSARRLMKRSRKLKILKRSEPRCMKP